MPEKMVNQLIYVAVWMHHKFEATYFDFHMSIFITCLTCILPPWSKSG